METWKKAAKNLFSILRMIKKKGYNSIAVGKIPNRGLGIAINDRLKESFIQNEWKYNRNQ